MKAMQILKSLNDDDMSYLKGVAEHPGKTDIWHCVNTMKYQGPVPEWNTKYPHNPRITLEMHNLIKSKLAGTGQSSVGTYFITKLGSKVLNLSESQAPSLI